jgi:hypothetical protein
MSTSLCRHTQTDSFRYDALVTGDGTRVKTAGDVDALLKANRARHIDGDEYVCLAARRDVVDRFFCSTGTEALRIDICDFFFGFCVMNPTYPTFESTIMSVPRTDTTPWLYFVDNHGGASKTVSKTVSPAEDITKADLRDFHKRNGDSVCDNTEADRLQWYQKVVTMLRRAVDMVCSRCHSPQMAVDIVRSAFPDITRTEAAKSLMKQVAIDRVDHLLSLRLPSPLSARAKDVKSWMENSLLAQSSRDISWSVGGGCAK